MHKKQISSPLFSYQHADLKKKLLLTENVWQCILITFIPLSPTPLKSTPNFLTNNVSLQKYLNQIWAAQIFLGKGY